MSAMVEQPGAGARRRTPLRLKEGRGGLSVLGSEARVPGGIDGECKLCRATTRLQLSHIVPAWAYKWMKLEGSVDYVHEGVASTWAAQDGAKQYLLCAACEQRLGDAERYLAVLCRSQPDEMAAVGMRILGTAQLAGVNRWLVLRGLLGILFKAHFSDVTVNAKISISGHEVEHLRRALQRDAYGDVQYGVAVTKWVNVSMDPGVNPLAMVFIDWDEKRKPSRFTLTMGGMDFILYQTSSRRHDRRRPRAMGALWRPLFLTEDGHWYWLVGDIHLHRHVADKPIALHVHERGVRSVSARSTCPCGRGRPAAECCAGWLGRPSDDSRVRHFD